MRSCSTSWAAGAALALVLAACGGDDSGQSVTQQDTTTPDVAADTTVASDTDTTGDTTAPSDAADTAAPSDVADAADTAADTAADVITDRPLGAPCGGDAECLDGTCLGAPDGVCARGCGLDDECGGMDRTCEELPNGGKICVSPDDLAGLPCVSNDGCPGDTVCHNLDDGTSRCVFPCNDFNCSVGFTCDTDSLTCLPPGGFDCTLFDIAAGVVGRCAVGNDFGECAGEFACTGAGPISCSAKTPAEEVCDGLDNDCDTELDEATCDDSDDCTVDACDSANAVCVFTADPGAECDDGNPCTTGDRCGADGSCSGMGSCACADVADCPIPDTLDAECLTVSCEGTPLACVYTPTNEGAGCSDGDACTEGDLCDGGACVAAPKDCSAFDSACAAATCAGGTCVPPMVSCTWVFDAHPVSAAFNYTPANLHWLQCSVGHTGPTGVDQATGSGHSVHWGFHATRP